MNAPDHADCIDTVATLASGSALHELRRTRQKVVDASQGSLEAVFDPALPGLTMAERLAAAQTVARESGCPALADFYAHMHGQAASPAAAERGTPTPRLDAILDFAGTLARRPIDGDRPLLLRLPAVGLSTPDVVTLAQLIGLVAYQARVAAGLEAMTAWATTATAASMPGTLAPPATDASVFVHPANLPAPGEPVRVNGFTSEPLDWKAWLPVLDMAHATDHQKAVLKASHPTATTSDYYLTLAQQPRILEERSAAFNAIMYAPGGLPRAERELASTVVSRVNGCVYCAAVHALRFEQLTRRNDVIVQVFTDPDSAGTTARERAIVLASIALTREPATFGPDHLRPLLAEGLGQRDMLDLIHSIAIFAWANRLMLNLGEPVYSAR